MSVVSPIIVLSSKSPKERQHMAHLLEQSETGETAFASLREPAWHGLGTVFQEEVSTKKMLELAHLDNWNVRLEDVEIPNGFESDKNYSFVTRTNPFNAEQNDVLGVVGERYVPLQNEELFDFGDLLLDNGGRWETAGSIKSGRVVFGSLALERETVLDKDGVADKVNTYLLINTSHDGSIAIQASITPVRVVCANTLNLALGSGRRGSVKQSFKIRHTQTASGKIAIAREALGLTHQYMDEFDKMANEMIQTEVSKAQFDKIVETLYPTPKDETKKASITKHNSKIDLINEIYVGDYNNTISGTAWGVANAMTERLDWYRNGRKGSNESILASASGFDPMTNAEKNRIFKTVRELVKA
jgi:phage/plasmid-like protein (TIGR03299 family)